MTRRLTSLPDEGAHAIDDAVVLRARLHEVEQRIREVEERYALATSAALDGIYEWDLLSGRLLLTQRAAQFFALPADELTPKAWNDCIHPDDFQGYRDALVRHFKGEVTHLEHEYRIRDAAGGYRWILDRGTGVRVRAAESRRSWAQ